MATTLSVTSKTPTTITFSVTKTSSTLGVLSIGTGTTWQDLYTNPTYQQQFGANQSGTFSVTFTGVASNTKYNANAVVIGGGESEISSIIDATLPAPAMPSVTLQSVETNRASFVGRVLAGGGYYSRAIQISLDDGETWSTRSTISGTIDADSAFTTSGNLIPNTGYTMLTRVTTTAGSTASPTVTFTTLAEAPTVTFVSSTDSSATFNYSAAADGGVSDKIVQYSLDGGTTWTTAATITGGAAVSGAFTVSGLSANTNYTIQVRNSTNAGESTVTSVQFSTQPTPPAPPKKLYGSVSGQAEEVKRLYGPVDNAGPIEELTGEIRAGGAGNVTAFDNVVFLNAVRGEIVQSKTLSYARVQTNATGTKASLYLGYTDSTEQVVASPTFSGLSSYGITGVVIAAGSDYIDLTLVRGAGAQRITKLYGRVNGQSKLIYQGFGHLTYA